MTLKVGLIVGREWSFPPAFIEEVNRRDQGVVAEYVKLGAPRMDEPCEYTVIIDRISHEVPFYRTYLKHAALQGCTIINNPFMWTADDKFLGATLATRLGIAHPKTVVLPNKEYIPGIVHEESLRNLQYPLDWQGIAEYIGMPCILKDAHGGGWKDVYVCRSLEELIHHYDTSGLLTMIVQEFIEWDQFIRCICIGQDKVMPIKYDPRERKYHVEHDHLSPELGKRVVDDSLKLVRALGYDMNSMEWAVRDGIPYAIDFMNPAPDMDVYSLTPHYFDWVVNAMADMAIDLAKNPRRQVKDLRWSELFASTREAGGGALGAGGRSEPPSGTTAAADNGGAMGSGGRSEPSNTTAADNGGAAGSNGRTESIGTAGGGFSGSGGRSAETAAGSGGGGQTGGFASTEGGGAGGHTGGAPSLAGAGGGEQTGASASSAPSLQGGSGGGGFTGEASPATEPVRAGGGSVVDQSPATDLEPPAEAPGTPRAYSEPPETNQAPDAGESRGKEAGNGRDDGPISAGGRAAEEQS